MPTKLLMKEEFDDFLPTRRTLLSRLRNWEDQESWRDFFYTYWKLIYSAAKRAGLNDVEAQEVVQETVIGVAKCIPEFQYDPQKGSFKGWLLFLTRRAISKKYRSRRRRYGNAEEPGKFVPLYDSIGGIAGSKECELEKYWDAEWNKNLIDAAIGKVKLHVNPKHFQIFSYSVIKEWPAKKVAQTLNVNIAQVYLIKHRIAKLVQREVKRLENETI